MRSAIWVAVFWVCASVSGCFRTSRHGLVVETDAGISADGGDVPGEVRDVGGDDGRHLGDPAPFDLVDAASPDLANEGDTGHVDLADLSVDPRDGQDLECGCGLCEPIAPSTLLVGDWGYWLPMDASDLFLARRFRAAGWLESDAARLFIGQLAPGFQRTVGHYRDLVISGEMYAYQAPGLRFEERNPSSGELQIVETPYTIFTPEGGELDYIGSTGYQAPPERLSFDVFHNLPIDSIRYGRIQRRYHRPAVCNGEALTLLEESEVFYSFDTLPWEGGDGTLHVHYSVKWRPNPTSPLQTKSGDLKLSFKLAPLPSSAAMLELIDVWKAIDDSAFWDCDGGYSVCDAAYAQITASRFYLGVNGGFMIPINAPIWHPIPATADDLEVPSGAFLMGSPEGIGRADEHPQRSVTLAPFRIDRTEVRIGDYKACVKAGFCTDPEMIGAGTFEKRYSDPGFADRPIQFVTWGQALTYCVWRGKRLPTEAEWEKAARGTDGRRFPWGDVDDPTLYYAGLDSLVPVESYPDGKSPYGALNMLGNAPEWVLDWYDPTYYLNGSLTDPEGPTTVSDDQRDNRVIRGFWGLSESPYLARRMSYFELQIFSSTAPYGIGFRCAR
ncbi:MAG: SUMF1/EgtB/PvdO family nonheme iron enzyme [Myxococcales bacterium]|nr:SUMF1/EgtB/PvdO family nonheme iron enzyme [Myxococcales bacterium]